VAIGAAVMAAAASLALNTSEHPAHESSPAPRTPAPPTPVTPTPSMSAAATPTPSRSEKIDAARTDTGKPLAERDLWPTSHLGMAGRGWIRDKTQTIKPCSWAARRELAAALQTCQRVVRATLVDDRHEVAVTVGVAVMPTRQDALTASQAGDPTDREDWWRGMRGRIAENIDEAAGVPATTVRGRYLLYAWATYFDGRTPADGDPLLTGIGRVAISYTMRPIAKRAE
jgi:hypothetical protein